MHIDIPRHPGSLSFKRSDLPQIRSHDVPEFIQELKRKGIKVERKHVDPAKLRATQNEFNLDKVRAMIHKGEADGKPSMTSSDGYVLDGHHRWLKDHNTKQKHETIHIGLPIHDLIRHAHSFGKSFTKAVTESTKDIVMRVVNETRAQPLKKPAEAYGWFNAKGTFIRNRKHAIHGETYKKWDQSVKNLNHRDGDDYDQIIDTAKDKGWARVDIFKDDDFSSLEGVIQNKHGKWTSRHDKNLHRVIRALGARKHVNQIDHIQESETHGWIDDAGKWHGIGGASRTHADVYMNHLKQAKPSEASKLLKDGGENWRQANGLIIRHAKKNGWLHTYIDGDGYGMIAGKKHAFEKHRAAVDALKARYKSADVTHIHEAVEG